MVESNTLTEDKHCFDGEDCHHVPTTAIDVASWMNRFVSQLHEALDLQLLFETFTNKFKATLSYDCIEYKDDSTRTYLVDGLEGKHHCVYALKYKELSLGNISISRNTVFLKHELEIIEVMLAGLTLPLRNALSYKQAINMSQRDQLTGLRNRTFYNDVIELEINRTQRYKNPFSLLMFDIDDFDGINNDYGRSAADVVLVEVAKRIENQTRNSDTVYSNGVDQFLVLLPRTVEPVAIETAGRIKDFVLSDKCIVGDDAIPFTLSAGVATVIYEDTVKRLMDRVGGALLQAKRLGRNRISSALQTDNIQAGYL